MFAAVLIALGLLLEAAPGRAHDDRGDEHRAKFEATLVADADAGDYAIGSEGHNAVVIEAEDGGRVRMVLADVTDAGGMPATAPSSQLTVVGLVAGAPFSTTFSFDLVDGRGTVDASLGIAGGSLLEIQTVTVASPATGVFAVPGVRGDDDEDDNDQGDQDGDDGDRGDGDHDDFPVAGDRDGDCDHDGSGDGKFRTALVGDFDAGDYAVDSAMGSFLSIEGEEGGEVKMRLAGVTDVTGHPVDHPGNQLVVTGARNGTPFSATFAFDLVGGAGEVRGTLSLTQDDVIEVQTVTVTDGTSVFAVPGLFIRGTDDSDVDGVADGGDACLGTNAYAMVSGDGCSLRQRCGCESRRALRACLRAAANEIRTRLRASCIPGKGCRRQARGLAAERRSVLRSCWANSHR